MLNDYIRVKKGPLLSCLTCPLCKNLFKEATTICICLHTFCRDCIYQNFEEDVSNCCPVCKFYLGSIPERVRPDYTLREIVRQIFPLGINTITEKRSEGLLAGGNTTQRSIGNDEANETQNICVSQENPRRTEISQDLNQFPNELSCDSALTVKKAILGENRSTRKEANRMTQNAVSRETRSEIQDAGRAAEKRNYLCQTLNELSCSSIITLKKANLCESILPQVCFTKSDVITPEEFATEACENPNQEGDACYVDDENRKNRTCKTFPISDLNQIDMPIKKQRSRTTSSSPGRSSNDGMLGVSSLLRNQRSDCDRKPLDSEKSHGKASSTEGSYDEMKMPNEVWICLLACEDKTGNALPQIPKPYIRTKCGDQAATLISKYLAQKLNLEHESEVEVMCYDEPLIPNLTLKDLLNMWVEATFEDDVEPVYLNSGEGSTDCRKFVMDLTYRRNKL